MCLLVTGHQGNNCCVQSVDERGGNFFGAVNFPELGYLIVDALLEGILRLGCLLTYTSKVVGGRHYAGGLGVVTVELLYRFRAAAHSTISGLHHLGRLS